MTNKSSLLASGARRELCAEFLATLVLMLFGLGVNAQVTLGASDIEIGEAAKIVDRSYGDFFTINTGWGIGVMLAVFVGAGVSGAHLNPAVTIALAVRGQFAWKKVAPYIVVQILAAVLASLIVCSTYYEATNAFEAQRGAQVDEQGDPTEWTMQTAGMYATYPREFANGRRLSNWGGLVDQIVGTGLLLLCVCAIGDQRNMAPKSNLAPFAVGAVVWMVGMSFGANCGYAINPARDLGPRLFTWIAGWQGVFSTPNGYWWLVPIVGPIIGGIIGATMYDWFVARQHVAEPSDDATAHDASEG